MVPKINVALPGEQIDHHQLSSTLNKNDTAREKQFRSGHVEISFKLLSLSFRERYGPGMKRLYLFPCEQTCRRVGHVDYHLYECA